MSLLEQRWYVLVDDLIGGYSIANVDKGRTSALDWRQGDSELGNFISEEVAVHIVKQHNLLLDVRDSMTKGRGYLARYFEDLSGTAGQREDDSR